jgi:hypothetical protein
MTKTNLRKRARDAYDHPDWHEAIDLVGQCTPEGTAVGEQVKGLVKAIAMQPQGSDALCTLIDEYGPNGSFDVVTPAIAAIEQALDSISSVCDAPPMPSLKGFHSGQFRDAWIFLRGAVAVSDSKVSR